MGQTAPAHVALVDGAAMLHREGQAEAAVTGMPLVSGDRLETERGRVEVLFPDGSALDIDEHTRIDFLADDLIRLLRGRVLLTVAKGSDPQPVAYRIDAPGATVEVREPGEYRVATLDGTLGPEVELLVRRGRADLANERGAIAVRAGERSVVRGSQAPSFPLASNSAAWDAFDRWADDRRAARLGAASARYLPDDVLAYTAAFDRYGHWRQDSSYGPVWYPAVGSDWRPYFNGYWTSLRAFGTTWIGSEPWAWPTHHFGRWGFAGGAWFWIPRRGWGPAWVSWAVAPGFVGWCPLGFDGRPLVNISIFNSGRRDLFRANGIYDPWFAWTLIPRERFAFQRHVPPRAVRPHLLSPDLRGAFITQGASPFDGVAVPRSPRGLEVGRAPGRDVPPPARAVPRDPYGSPRVPDRRRSSSVPGGIASPAAVVPPNIAVPRASVPRESPYDRAERVRRDRQRRVVPQPGPPYAPAVPRSNPVPPLYGRPSSPAAPPDGAGSPFNRRAPLIVPWSSPGLRGTQPGTVYAVPRAAPRGPAGIPLPPPAASLPSPGPFAPGAMRRMPPPGGAPVAPPAGEVAVPRGSSRR